jgi:hypothetical protein
MLDLTIRRTGDRVWWTELEALLSEGYKIVLHSLDASVADATACDHCGHHRMEYRGFVIEGIANRSFALCDMCEHWFEF